MSNHYIAPYQSHYSKLHSNRVLALGHWVLKVPLSLTATFFVVTRNTTTTISRTSAEVCTMTSSILPHCGADVTAERIESISPITPSSTFRLLIISSCVNATQKAGLICICACKHGC